MFHILLVGVGGFIGSICRYAIQNWVQRGNLFPFGTLIVNILGCATVGYLGGLTEFRGIFSADTKIFLFVGVLGGFTTYSAYGFETVKLLRDGEIGYALTNVALHLGLGLGSVWAGYMLAKR